MSLYNSCVIKNNMYKAFLKGTCSYDAYKLYCKHSSGFDSISIRLLKITITSIVEPLCLIFNKSFLTGQLPINLKIAKICLKFKSCDKMT